MYLEDFLAHRAAFAGVPYGELAEALAAVHRGRSWDGAFHGIARRLYRLAASRQANGHAGSAAGAWLAAASAFQTASFGMHFTPHRACWPRRVRRLRQLVRLAYRQALQLDGALGRAVRLPMNGGSVDGYLRYPRQVPRAVVVLVNGLDSVCEVELHRFGDAFLERGFAVLALALPDRLCECGGVVGYRAESAAEMLVTWLRRHDLELPLSCFGVSFGGHLVARLLASGAFCAGVAVSPAAWLDGRHLHERLQRMIAMTFGVSEMRELHRLTGGISLQGLGPPLGRLLVLHMERDELFGAEHLRAILDWAGERAERRWLDAEHVGTSRIHQWLPEACDWLQDHLLPLTEILEAAS